jgi:hypothetical protein
VLGSERRLILVQLVLRSIDPKVGLHAFVVEHNLLTELFGSLMIHASVIGFASDFIETIPIIGEDSKKGSASRSWASQHKKLYWLVTTLLFSGSESIPFPRA